jgi:hypothetical protein
MSAPPSSPFARLAKTSSRSIRKQFRLQLPHPYVDAIGYRASRADD